jgi:hypothetical protein
MRKGLAEIRQVGFIAVPHLLLPLGVLADGSGEW